MPLSEKELETFLWEHPAACATRGLAIDYNFYRFGRRYHKQSLGPYGIAPLVSVRYWPPERTYYVQVLVFTRSALTTALYQQAKRYQTGLRDALRRALRAADITAAIELSCVLIGQRVHLKDDFVYALNLDTSCQAFTYTYSVNGLSFENVGRGWHRAGSEDNAALVQLAADLLSQREEELAEAEKQVDSAEQLAARSLPEDNLAALVVTAEGILINEAQEGEEEYE
jgi:hypothetical protein